MKKNILDKIKQFVPINPNTSKNSKGFRILKNGMDTWIFQKARNKGENDIINNIEEEHQNDEEVPID